MALFMMDFERKWKESEGRKTNVDSIGWVKKNYSLINY